MDTVVDLVARSLFWVHLDYPKVSGIVVIVEWLCFACAHVESVVTSSHWKAKTAETPKIVSLIMTKLFMFAMAGIYGLPLWLYICQYLPQWWLAHRVFGYLTISGRVAAIIAEIWYIYKHFR